MDNMANIISSHNNKITNSYKETNGKTYSLWNKSNCALHNKCLTVKIVYKADFETNDCVNELSTKVYFGISVIEFKCRYNNHTMSFRNRTHKNDTELSKHIWSLKYQNKNFDIKWLIFKKSSGYSIVSNSCNLCLLEKLVLCNFKEKDRLLNKQLDLVLKCRHENKYILMNYSVIDYYYYSYYCYYYFYYYNYYHFLIFIFTCKYNLLTFHVCYIYKNLIEKINITSEGYSISVLARPSKIW